MSRHHAIPWLAVGLFALVTIFGALALARKISQYNKENPHTAPFFMPVDTTDFTFMGHEVHISDKVDEQGNGDLIVRYDDAVATIPVGVPNPYNLPGLAKHEDWLGVFLVGEPEGRSFDEFQQAVRSGTITPRLIFVSRHLNPGIDNNHFGFSIDTTSREYGETMRKRWTFGFLELLPDGKFRQWTRKFPESERAFEGRTQAALLAGNPAPDRDPDELKENTWEWYAALQIIPAGKAPTRSFNDSPIAQTGWTFPVTAIGVLGLMFCLAWAMAPSKVATWTDEEKQPASA